LCDFVSSHWPCPFRFQPLAVPDNRGRSDGSGLASAVIGF
jgi:hypothetical protein